MYTISISPYNFRRQILRIHFAFAKIFRPAAAANQLIFKGLLPCTAFRQRFAETGTSDLRKQLFEIMIAMLISPLQKMQMIMAKLMLNNFLRFFLAVVLKLMRTDLDIMCFREITPAG